MQVQYAGPGAVIQNDGFLLRIRLKPYENEISPEVVAKWYSFSTGFGGHDLQNRPFNNNNKIFGQFGFICLQVQTIIVPNMAPQRRILVLKSLLCLI